MRFDTSRLGWFAALSVMAVGSVACSSSGDDPSTGSPNLGADGGPGDVSVVPVDDGSTPSFGDSASDARSTCQAPDLLIVLDRSASMHATLDGTKPPDTAAGRARTKWGLAVTAVEAATAPPRDGTIRFGLELFPQDPKTTGCKTVSQMLAGQTTTNPTCQTGELLVVPDLSAGAKIAASISTDTTRLCLSTPITSAMTLAESELAKIKVAARGQFVLLVTDGAETCGTDVVPLLAQLAVAGVRTFVVGFGTGGASAGIDRKALNDMACAGQTAPGFPADCVAKDGGGGYVAKDPAGKALFFDAKSGEDLSKALDEIGRTICCDCVK